MKLQIPVHRIFKTIKKKCNIRTTHSLRKQGLTKLRFQNVSTTYEFNTNLKKEYQDLLM
jgi:uncharacterized protein (UPF0248 family)